MLKISVKDGLTHLSDFGLDLHANDEMTGRPSLFLDLSGCSYEQ